MALIGRGVANPPTIIRAQREPIAVASYIKRRKNLELLLLWRNEDQVGKFVQRCHRQAGLTMPCSYSNYILSYSAE